VLECGGCEGRSTAPLHSRSFRGDELNYRSSTPTSGSTTNLQHFRIFNAYYANLVLPAQEIYLRIPGAADYWHELDVRISSVLAGKTKPKEALDDIYQAWEQITDRYGRESQKKLYAESYGAS
jgi:hypothetical protein